MFLVSSGHICLYSNCMWILTENSALNVLTAVVMLLNPSAMIWDRSEGKDTAQLRGRHTKSMVGKLMAFKPVTWVSRLRETVMNDWMAVITWSEV